MSAPGATPALHSTGGAVALLPAGALPTGTETPAAMPATWVP